MAKNQVYCSFGSLFALVGVVCLFGVESKALSSELSSFDGPVELVQKPESGAKPKASLLCVGTPQAGSAAKISIENPLWPTIKGTILAQKVGTNVSFAYSGNLMYETDSTMTYAIESVSDGEASGIGNISELKAGMLEVTASHRYSDGGDCPRCSPSYSNDYHFRLSLDENTWGGRCSTIRENL